MEHFLTGERVERRLAAILAADVAGYSRLMGKDEVWTLRELTQRRVTLDSFIAFYRGRIANTAGDSVLAEFGSAVDAVQCAVEAQAALTASNVNVPPGRQINFRIGVHVGDVMVKNDDLFGDGVNIAARLEAIAQPGGICISDDAWRQIRGKVDIAFDDIGPQVLKNIAEPMRAWRARIDGADSPVTPTRPLNEQAQPIAIPDKPSIAVLPFQNMSDDPEQEYFADGIVEEIITALSRFRSLLVIARNTSFTYKGKAVDIKQVGRELGVRYVLEGSVRKAGGRVRITGQLIDAETGAHLWADKIDGVLEDVFDLQDQVTSSVVGAIAPAVELAETERTKRKPTANLDSYDLFMRGSSAIWEGRLKEAISYFKRAIEKDDRYANAYGLCAGAYVVLQSYGGVALSSEDKLEAIRFANLAATLGTDDAMTLARAAQALVYFDKQYERAMAMADRAIALNPNLASVWLIRGWVLRLCGQPEESIKSFFRALQFSELDPARIGAYCGISYGCFMLGRYEEGCVWAAKALQKYENTLYLVPLIANAMRAGREDEALNAVARLLQLVPDIRVSRLKELTPPRCWLESFGQALVEAGVPE